VVSGDADDGLADFESRGQLRLLDRALDRLDRLFEVDHHTLPQADRRARAHAEHGDAAVRLGLSDDQGDLAGADVETGDDAPVLVCA
jgi:hypothetical protein